VSLYTAHDKHCQSALPLSRCVLSARRNCRECDVVITVIGIIIKVNNIPWAYRSKHWRSDVRLWRWSYL